jgi:putative SOS response-associated peptidase YedK
MCFYNSNSKRAIALAKRYGKKTNIIEMAQEILDEQYKINAFAHPDCAIITENQSIEIAKWGLIPFWVKTADEALKIRKMTLNARSETIFGLPSFRAPILTKRCLIPSTGFFEFHHTADKKVIPHYIFLRDDDIFSFGGVYEIWQNTTTKETTQTFSVLTTTANELCAKIHNGGKNPFRMPVIISKENEEFWLDKSLGTNDIKPFFQPFDTVKMDAYPISRDFLKRSPKDASIIEPAVKNNEMNVLF